MIFCNATIHDSRSMCEYHGDHSPRIVIHFLPKYSPDLNPIERIWWHLHDEIIRNRRFRSREELLDLVFE